jgi:hypothetical protein
VGEWPGTREELVEEQLRLAALDAAPWRFEPGARIGAVFVCFARGGSGPGRAGDPAWAAACAGRETVAVAGRAAAPYEAGVLALREGAPGQLPGPPRGRPRLASNEVPPSLLDEVLPRFDASEVHDVWVAAPPQVAFAAVKQVTVGEVRLLKPLEGMRARSPRARTPSSTRPSSARVARSRFTRTTAARRSTWTCGATWASTPATSSSFSTRSAGSGLPPPPQTSTRRSKTAPSGSGKKLGYRFTAFSLEDAADAHAAVERGAVGKVLITVGADKASVEPG